MSATDEVQAGAAAATCQHTLRPPTRACMTGQWGHTVSVAPGPEPGDGPITSGVSGPYLMLDVLIAPTSELTNN